MTAAPSKMTRAAWLVPALVALVFAVYWPGIGGGFAFDDFPNIVDNATLHVSSLDPDAWLAAVFSSPASDLRRPLAMLTFAINHYFTGIDPEAMKVTNIAIHAANALLVAGLLRALFAWVGAGGRKVTRPELLATSVAAAWALHPINLTSVLYVVQRMESLAHTFVFAGLWLYVEGRRRQLVGRPGAALMLAGLVACTALGMLAKESAALLPLYAFCLELCVGRFLSVGGRLDRRLPALYVVVLVVPAIAGTTMLLLRALRPGAFAFRPFTLAERLLTEGRVVVDYLRWTVLPDPAVLSLYHDDYQVSRGVIDPLSTLFALFTIAALLGIAWALRRARPLTALGLFWFIGAQAMTATIVPLELVYEHRNYFASLGVCLVLADLLLLAPKGELIRVVGRMLAVVFLLWSAAVTHVRAREWSDPLRFVQSEAHKRPRSPRAMYALGQMLVILSRYQPESSYVAPARQALERARALPDSGILPHSALLLLAAHLGQPLEEEWWLDMQQRLRTRPIGPQDTSAIGSLSRCARDGECPFPRQRMVGTFEAGLTRPTAEMYNLYADYTVNVLHDPQTAARLWRQAVLLRPDIGQYRINLAKLLIATGRRAEARNEIQELRKTGRLREYEAAAKDLERRLGLSASGPPHSSTR